VINFRDFLAYDPETGLLTWVGGDPRCVGKVAGSKSKKGYVTVEVQGMRYRAHLIAFWFMTGEWLPNEVDHRDRDGGNNCWANLRKATATQQTANKRLSSRSKTGFKGVSKSGKHTYRATLSTTAEGRRHLGSFATPELAHARWLEEAVKCYGEFACAG